PVEALCQGSADEHASAVPFAARPAERVQLRDQVGHFGGVENLREVGRDRPRCYLARCQASSNLVWSRPRRLQSRGGTFWSIFLFVKPNSTGSVGRNRPGWRAWKQGERPRPSTARAGLVPRVVWP